MITTAPFMCSGRRSDDPAASERHYRRSASLGSRVTRLAVFLRFYLAAQPKVVFMACPGRVS